MIAPPQQLYLNTPTQPNMPRKKPTTGSLGKKLGFGTYVKLHKKLNRKIFKLKFSKQIQT